MDYNEAQKVIDIETRQVFRKKLHPDGYTFELYVFDDRKINRNLNNIGIKLWANGTWEYTKDLDLEED